MAALDGDVPVIQIGQRARDAQHPVITARGQFELFGSVYQKRLAGGIGRGHRFEVLPVGLGVGEYGFPGIAGFLYRPRGSDPGRNLCTTFGRRW